MFLVGSDLEADLLLAVHTSSIATRMKKEWKDNIIFSLMGLVGVGWKAGTADIEGL